MYGCQRVLIHYHLNTLWKVHVCETDIYLFPRIYLNLFNYVTLGFIRDLSYVSFSHKKKCQTKKSVEHFKCQIWCICVKKRALE